MTDYDSPWKQVLERYFQEFLAFFFPLAHAGIDWTQGYTLLDKELQKIVRDATLGRRYADKLIKVWRRDGGEVWVLAHIEVQGHYEADFAERMFSYYSRLRDRYQRQVVSLAVLTDAGLDWRPTEYRQGLWGCELHWRYPVVKLLDYRDREAELEAHANPFAVVVLAHLKALETVQDSVSRFRWKARLARGLYHRGLLRQDVLELFRFLDWVLVFPEVDEARLWTELRHYEEQQVMRYVTNVERIGIKKGMERGIEKGLRLGQSALLRRMLMRRFGELPDWAEAKLHEATPDQLERWGEQLLDAACLENVFEAIGDH